MNLIDLAKLNDEQARDYLETIRWPNGPVCPHCGSKNCTRLDGKAHRHGTIQCNACRGQFTVTVGSVMESSHIPLVKWAMGFHLMCSSKKGFSAKQLQRELGLGSYRSAWFMAHRIRHAMTVDAPPEPLDGNVEVDETYVGGKPRYKGQSKRGRGTKKASVVVLVERDGSGARCHPIPNVTKKTLHAEVVSAVAKSATILTDELASYKGIGEKFDGGHQTVNHGKKEYARKTDTGLNINTNTAESFFALLKRGHYGVYHSMSKKHLHRYCDEFAFRWQLRKVNDGSRTVSAIAAAEGKRLMYETPCP
jgi:transposase-like protein